jgi:hypothetical protein
MKSSLHLVEMKIQDFMKEVIVSVQKIKTFCGITWSSEVNAYIV